MSKVSYTKCDICDSEIIKGGYRLINKPLGDNSKRNGGEIDVCEQCMEILTRFTFSEEQCKKFEQISPILLIAHEKTY